MTGDVTRVRVILPNYNKANAPVENLKAWGNWRGYIIYEVMATMRSGRKVSIQKRGSVFADGSIIPGPYAAEEERHQLQDMWDTIKEPLLSKVEKWREEILKNRKINIPHQNLFWPGPTHGFWFSSDGNIVSSQI